MINKCVDSSIIFDCRWHLPNRTNIFPFYIYLWNKNCKHYISYVMYCSLFCIMFMALHLRLCSFYITINNFKFKLDSFQSLDGIQSKAHAISFEIQCSIWPSWWPQQIVGTGVIVQRRGIVILRLSALLLLKFCIFLIYCFSILGKSA